MKTKSGFEASPSIYGLKLRHKEILARKLLDVALFSGLVSVILSAFAHHNLINETMLVLSGIFFIVSFIVSVLIVDWVNYKDPAYEMRDGLPSEEEVLYLREEIKQNKGRDSLILNGNYALANRRLNLLKNKENI